MKTLKGVIAATTYADYQTPLTDSNLFIEPWYFTISSRPYEVEFKDESRTGIIAQGVRLNKQPLLRDDSETSLTLTKITKTRTVFYTTYTVTPEESETSLVLTKITKTRVVSYSTYTNIPEDSETSLILTKITKTRVVGYLDYTVPPDESETSLALTKITKTRVTL